MFTIFKEEKVITTGILVFSDYGIYRCDTISGVFL